MPHLSKWHLAGHLMIASLGYYANRQHIQLWMTLDEIDGQLSWGKPRDWLGAIVFAALGQCPNRTLYQAPTQKQNVVCFEVQGSLVRLQIQSRDDPIVSGKRVYQIDAQSVQLLNELSQQIRLNTEKASQQVDIVLVTSSITCEWHCLVRIIYVHEIAIRR